MTIWSGDTPLHNFRFQRGYLLHAGAINEQTALVTRPPNNQKLDASHLVGQTADAGVRVATSGEDPSEPISFICCLCWSLDYESFAESISMKKPWKFHNYYTCPLALTGQCLLGVLSCRSQPLLARIQLHQAMRPRSIPGYADVGTM